MTLNHWDNDFCLFSCRQSHRTATPDLFIVLTPAHHYPVGFVSFVGNKGPWLNITIKMGHINVCFLSYTSHLLIYVNPLRMLEDQIYINNSQNCYSNIGLEAYPT